MFQRWYSGAVLLPLLFLSMLSISGCKWPGRAASKQDACTAPLISDRYFSFQALQEAETEGVSFLRTVQKKDSKFLVTAIHGGLLEKGTDVLANALAGQKHNLYIFNALVEDDARMHVTSHRFDDPALLQLAEESQNCISLHGFYVNLGAEVCIGGRNLEMKTAVFEALQAFDPSLRVLYPCKEFAGEHAKNIVNRCQHQGVQLELSAPFRQKLLREPKYFDGFVKTLQQALGL